MAHVKLKDIAEMLNVSIPTVSKALNGSKEISEETRQKVLNMARILNYTPNQLAINLRNNESKTIGVIVPSMVHHFFSRVIEGIIEGAEKAGYLVILLQSNEKLALEKQQVDLLMDKRVDGILVSLSNETNEFLHLKKILKRKIPLVLFDKVEPSINCSKVMIDDEKAAYKAVMHLIKKGHKRIAHFRGDGIPKISRERFEGYKRALADSGITFDESLVYVCDNNDDFSDGYRNAQKMLSEHDDVEAVFAITDLVAIGVIKFFNEINVKIPGQIAVFGFSNWLMSSVVSPTLSTVNQPAYEMGSTALELLLNEIENNRDSEPGSHCEYILPTELVIRESC